MIYLAGEPESIAIKNLGMFLVKHVGPLWNLQFGSPCLAKWHRPQDCSKVLNVAASLEPVWSCYVGSSCWVQMLGCTKSRHLRPWHSSNVAKQATKSTMNCVFLPSSQSQSFGKSFRKPSNTWTNPSLRQHTWLQATYPLYPDLLVESYIVTFDIMRHDSDMILHCFQFSVNFQSLKVFGSRNCDKTQKNCHKSLSRILAALAVSQSSSIVIGFHRLFAPSCHLPYFIAPPHPCSHGTKTMSAKVMMWPVKKWRLSERCFSTTWFPTQKSAICHDGVVGDWRKNNYEWFLLTYWNTWKSKDVHNSNLCWKTSASNICCFSTQDMCWSFKN